MMTRIRRQAIQLISCLMATMAVLMHTSAWAQKIYSPDRVVYDISSSDAKSLSAMLDRASLLQKLYQNDSFNAAIVFVIHEGAVPLFAKNNIEQNALMQRAKSLSLGEMIQFRLCRASARMQGYKETDFHDFVQLVPMADAELIELQHQGYAYIR